MKVYISVDMEGISGLVRWADVASTGIDYPRNRSLLTADTNAAIEGAFRAGADEVVVEENHGVEDLCNVVMDEIDPRCRVVRGAGRPGATTMAALDASIDVVLLVGHHARAGSRPGIMAHTISYGQFKRVRLSGRDVGEPDLFAIRAGELGVPIGLVSGDQVVAEQVHAVCPWAEAVIVKDALGNQSGNCIPPERAQVLIAEGTQRAVDRAADGALPPYVAESAPYEFEVEMRSDIVDGLRENLSTMQEFQIIDERTIRIQASDMDWGFRRVAYLGYGGTAGVTRH
ncbi:MAG: M55 family metallopeptidase [Gammaproteobacteria bacterium]|nr:M55 family metallopeptidase [Gammaproteobacteria bacterium]